MTKGAAGSYQGFLILCIDKSVVTPSKKIYNFYENQIFHFIIFFSRLVNYQL